jgi:hypothetical protein
LHGRIQLNFCGVGRRASCVKLRLKPTINVAGSRVPIPPAPLLRRGVGGGTRALFRHLAGWGHLGGKSVLSSPFKGDLGGATLGYNPCLDMVLACLLTQMASCRPPRYKLNAQQLVWELVIGDRRSAIIIIMPVSSPNIGD